MHLILVIPLLVLLMQGIGNSVATWQPCFLVLSGLYLYVLESEKSQSYQRYSRFAIIPLSLSLSLDSSMLLLFLSIYIIIIIIIFLEFLCQISCNKVLDTPDLSIYLFFWAAAAWLVDKCLRFLQQILVAHLSALP